MKLTVISTWKNEEYLAPFFIRHYLENGADQIIILFDISTTDRTLEILKEYKAVSVIPVSFPGPWCARPKTGKMRECYNRLDPDGWAILADADELVFSPEGPLKKEITKISALGYDVVSADFWHPYRHYDDVDLDVTSKTPVVYQRCHGVRYNAYGHLYNKPIVVRAGRNILWSPGQHCINGGHRMYHTAFPGAHWKFADPLVITCGRTQLNVTADKLKALQKCEEHRYDGKLFGGGMFKSDMNTQNTRLSEYFAHRSERQIHKWPHYFPIYEKHFAPFLGRAITMLEIGVQNGGSLGMWRDYFGQEATIVGLDVDPRCAELRQDGFNIVIGSQGDPAVLRQLAVDYGPFDIILDDGSHRADLTEISFTELFAHVRPGGIYMIEDTHTAYWNEFGGGFQRPGTAVELAKRLIDAQHAYHSKTPALAPDRFTQTVGGIHTYDSILVFDRINRSKVLPPEISGKKVIIPGTDHAFRAGLQNTPDIGRKAKTVVDVVMLANTTSTKLYQMTQRAINSLHASSRDIQFNVLLMESHVETTAPATGHNGNYICVVDKDRCITVRGLRYKLPFSRGVVGDTVNIVETPNRIVANFSGAEVVISHKTDPTPVSDHNPNRVYTGCTVVPGPQPFNYNRYMNMGIAMGEAEYVVLCNNDVLFREGWMEEMLRCGYDSMSPVSHCHPEQIEFRGIIKEGYRVRRELSGWCIVAKRSILEKIGKLDEDFAFYSADRVYAIQLRQAGGKHYIVGTAQVDHYQEMTTRDMHDSAWIASQINAAHSLIDQKYPGQDNG